MTKSSSAFRIPSSAFAWPMFGLVIVIVYFAGLTMPLVGPDEPRYAQVAREMYERGDWITPTLGGFHWFEKPALLYWLQISSYNLFGVSEFAARFGSALFGLGTVASLWILGRHVEKKHEHASATSFANWLAIIAGSTVGIIVFAKGASFDIILTFPFTAAMVSFFIYDTSRRVLPLVAFYFFVGVAVLAKGLIGIIFPAAVVGFYHLVLWRFPDRTLRLSFLWGGCLAIVVAGIWYLPMYLRHGGEFIDHFFVQHHFQRFTSNKYLHPQPFYFFFWVFPLMIIPKAPFFIASLWKLGGRLVSGEFDRESVSDRLAIFAGVWIAIPLIFFSFSGSKLPGYVLPAVPAAVILTAQYVYRFARKSAVRRYAVQALAASTFAIVVFSAIWVAPGFADSDSVKRIFQVADELGYNDAPVMMLHGISHNAEFYAAGRIVRDDDGRQKRFPGPKEVSDELANIPAGRALVIVPLQYLAELLNSTHVHAKALGVNGEVALVAVDAK